MSNGQLPNMVVPIHLYKVFISADAYLGKQARCTPRAGLCCMLLSSSGVFIVTLCLIQDPMNNSEAFHYSTSPVLFTGISSIWLQA